MKALFVLLALTPLVGCHQSSQSAVDGAIAGARHDVAKKEVAALEQQARTEAAADTDEVDAVRKAEKRKAASSYDVAVTEAEGRYKITRAQCDALNGDVKRSCVDRADASLTLSKADAEATRKAAGG
jgi:hypothetical protein